MSFRKLFDRFRKKGGEPEVSRKESVARPELQAVRAAFAAEDFDRAIALAESFLQSADAELRREAKKLVALCRFRQGDYRAAAESFRELAEGSTESGEWFNVVTASTLAGDIAAGEAAFETALKCQAAAGYAQQPSVPQMRHWYACALRDQKEHRRALDQIEALRAIYEQLTITDDTFLHLRGVPFLSHTMEVAVDVFHALGESIDATAWLDHFASNLDDEGQQYLAEVKHRLESMNPSDRQEEGS